MLALWLLALHQRTSILVRMPSTLKSALVRETARRESNVNDVAAGILADSFGVAYTPSGRRRKVLAGASPVLLLRVPQELKDEIHAEAARTRLQRERRHPRRARRRARRPPVPARERKRWQLTNGSKNGARAKDKVRVAIIGVGNCANSLLQGVEYYKDASPEDTVPGLMHVDLGGYHISDIEFTAAFDVVKGKVGVDLADAIWAHPNDTIKFSDVPKTGVKVSRGMTHDGIGKYMAQVVEKAPGQTDDVVGILKETGTDVVVNYLPVGSEAATKWYTEQILEAGVAMVNCMPVFIAREPYWQKRFEEAGVPIIGDDIKSQVGATITHRVLTTLFGDRGVHLDRTMQLNVGGNSDFRNMLERERLESKKISKTNAVTSMLDYDIGEDNVHVGPSDFVPWLTDRKWAYIRMEGSSFGDVPLNVELKLEVWDSPNSAGIVIDAVRLAKLALNNGIAGSLEAPSAYLMKSPPKQIRDDEAREQIERFIVKNAHSKSTGRRPRRRDGRPLQPDLLDRGGGDPHRRRPGRARGHPARRLRRHRRPHPRHARCALLVAGATGITGLALVERGEVPTLGWVAVVGRALGFVLSSTRSGTSSSTTTTLTKLGLTGCARGLARALADRDAAQLCFASSDSPKLVLRDSPARLAVAAGLTVDRASGARARATRLRQADRRPLDPRRARLPPRSRCSSASPRPARRRPPSAFSRS